MRTTQRKGDIGVAQSISTFTRLGYDVLLPLTESAAYDLAVDTGEGLRRVQVRFSSERNVELRRIHSNAKGYVVKKTRPDSYDWLYILRPDNSEYLIRKCLDGRRSICPTEEDRLMPIVQKPKVCQNFTE